LRKSESRAALLGTELDKVRKEGGAALQEVEGVLGEKKEKMAHLMGESRRCEEMMGVLQRTQKSLEEQVKPCPKYCLLISLSYYITVF
jgi:hypothetical protein